MAGFTLGSTEIPCGMGFPSQIYPAAATTAKRRKLLASIFKGRKLCKSRDQASWTSFSAVFLLLSDRCLERLLNLIRVLRFLMPKAAFSLHHMTSVLTTQDVRTNHTFVLGVPADFAQYKPIPDLISVPRFLQDPSSFKGTR